MTLRNQTRSGCPWKPLLKGPKKACVSAGLLPAYAEQILSILVLLLAQDTHRNIENRRILLVVAQGLVSL